MSPCTAIKDTPQRLKQEGHFVGPQISGSKPEGHAASTGASEAEGVYAMGETSSLEKTRGHPGNSRKGRAWNVANSLLL